MKRETYDDYITRFNAQDMTAFETYIAPNMHMQNGKLEFIGRQAMKDHYQVIWSTFTEALTVERFVSNEDTLAVQLWAHFTAQKDNPVSLFGAVLKDETFDFRGVIIYQIEDGQFTDICVAYNSFTYTDQAGKVVDMGIPH